MSSRRGREPFRHAPHFGLMLNNIQIVVHGTDDILIAHRPLAKDTPSAWWKSISLGL